MSLFDNFQRNIDSLAKQRKWKDVDVASRLGMKASQFNRYKKGHVEPGMEQLEKICGLFQISIAELLGSEIPKAPAYDDGVDKKRLSLLSTIIDADRIELETFFEALEPVIKGASKKDKGRSRGV